MIPYFIAYGFVAGRRVSQKLEHNLEKEGFYKVNSVEEAVVVIAHSAGCVNLRGLLTGKIVFLVGPAIQQQSVVKTFLQANRLGVKAMLKSTYRQAGLRLRVLSCYYAVREPLRNARIIMQILRKQNSLPPLSAPMRVVLIANQLDPWPRGLALERLITNGVFAFVSLPGAHDNIWEQPERYSAIIKLYAKRLLAETD